MKNKKINFQQTENYAPRNEKEKRIAQAFAKIKNEREAAAFLRDLLTLPEIEEFSNRLEIARLLMQGESYLKIARATGVSTTTVTRTAHWLFKGCGGYQKMLSNTN